MSVVGGYLTMAIGVILTGIVAAKVSGVDVRQPTLPSANYLIVNLVTGACFAAAGGFLAATIAQTSPLEHGAALAVVVILMGLLSMKQFAAQQPKWYQWTLLIGSPLFVMVGAALRSVF